MARAPFFVTSFFRLSYIVLEFSFFFFGEKKNCPSSHFYAMFGVKIDDEGEGNKRKINVILHYFIEKKKKKRKKIKIRKILGL